MSKKLEITCSADCRRSDKPNCVRYAKQTQTLMKNSSHSKKNCTTNTSPGLYPHTKNDILRLTF